MNKHVFLLIALPLVSASLCINILFWSGHTEHNFGKALAALWAVGLTGVEYLFPAWARQHWSQQRLSALAFASVGGAVAICSVWAFAMTLDNALAKPYQALEQKIHMDAQHAAQQALNRQLAEHTLAAANTALAAANRFNELDKISLGTLPALETFQQLSAQAKQIAPPPAMPSHSLQELRTLPGVHYLLSLSSLSGIERNTLKLSLALMLALLIEVASVMAVIILTRPQHPPQAASTATTNKPPAPPPPLPPLQQVRQDLLSGLHGEIPAISALPKYYQGTGLRFHDFQRLRQQMLEAGEFIPMGAKRVQLTRLAPTAQPQ